VNNDPEEVGIPADDKESQELDEQLLDSVAGGGSYGSPEGGANGAASNGV
jgi:hypothetical protein